MEPMTLEVVHFTTDPAAEAEVLAARQAMIDAVRTAFPSLRDARLFRGDGPGEWIDVLFWDDRADAERAVAEVGAIPDVARFFGLVDAEPTMAHGALAHEDLRTGADVGA